MDVEPDADAHEGPAPDADADGDPEVRQLLQDMANQLNLRSTFRATAQQYVIPITNNDTDTLQQEFGLLIRMSDEHAPGSDEMKTQLRKTLTNLVWANIQTQLQIVKYTVSNWATDAAIQGLMNRVYTLVAIKRNQLGGRSNQARYTTEKQYKINVSRDLYKIVQAIVGLNLSLAAKQTVLEGYAQTNPDQNALVSMLALIPEIHDKNKTRLLAVYKAIKHAQRSRHTDPFQLVAARTLRVNVKTDIAWSVLQELMNTPVADPDDMDAMTGIIDRIYSETMLSMTSEPVDSVDLDMLSGSASTDASSDTRDSPVEGSPGAPDNQPSVSSDSQSASSESPAKPQSAPAKRTEKTQSAPAPVSPVPQNAPTPATTSSCVIS